jgi:RHS repeat-associated protein
MDGWVMGTGTPTYVVWWGSVIRGAAENSGIQYLRNRYYDSRTGRFTQEDPIGLAGGLNLYGFAAGDPVNFSDPFGLCPPKDDNTADCAAGTSGWYANRLATGEGNAALNTIGGVLASCNESTACGLVLDVASLGAGALERRAAVAATEQIVIGETMTRVRSAAAEVGAGTFETTARTAKQMYRENMSWLRKGMRDGKQVIDIGTDANRAVRSPWYQLEKELIERRGYPVTQVPHP